MRLLLFNLATDSRDPLLGFGSQLIHSLAREVERLEVVSLRLGEFHSGPNVRVQSIGKERGQGDLQCLRDFYCKVRSILREVPIDVCFSHMNPLFTVLGAPLLIGRNIPIVTWYAHAQVTAILRVAHHCSAKIVTSADTAYQYRKADKKVNVIGQGIDLDLYTPGEDPAALPPFLLSVGRLSPVKDLITLIEATSIMRERGRDLRCVLVGDAPERHRQYKRILEKRIAELGLEEFVQFVGSLRNTEVLPWYRTCAAHVNLAPTGALDKAVLEAMACGRPSLMANTGFGEIVGEWSRDLMFRYGHADDLADKIDALLAFDGNKQSRMTDALRANVARNHSLKGLVQQLLAIFRSLCIKN